MTQDQGPNENPSGQGTGSGGQNQPPKATTGLEPNIAGLLSYLLTWLTGIIFLVIEKESPFVRFHAVQAIGLGVAWFIAYIVLFTLGVALPGFLGAIFVGLTWIVVWLGGVLIWLFMMYKAYQGEMVQLPIIGPIAKRESDKLVK